MKTNVFRDMNCCIRSFLPCCCFCMFQTANQGGEVAYRFATSDTFEGKTGLFYSRTFQVKNVEYIAKSDMQGKALQVAKEITGLDYDQSVTD